MSNATASIWTAPGRLERRDLPLPPVPVGGLLLRVEANGICGTDLHLLDGAPPRPTVLGHEIVGTVVAFGEGTARLDAGDEPLAEGDRVALFPWIPCGACWACRRFGPAAATCTKGFVYGIPFEATGAGGPSPLEDDATAPALTGGYGSHLVVYPGTYYWRVPDSMSSAVASLLDPLAVAVRAVDMTRTATGTWDEVLTPDSTAVVQGAGPVGLLTVLVLRALGVHRIIVTGARPSRLAAAASLGAEEVLDVRATSAADRLARVRAMTAGRGADLVIDCSNAPDALTEGIRLSRRLGTVVEVGNMVNAGSEIRLDPAVDICQRNIRLLGMSANPPRSYAEAMALLGREDLPFASLVTDEVPLSEPEAAFAALRGDAIKVVLVAD
ncbi:zinc-binding dehydrogenase [Planosporangium thailandense]|uniref:Zinc-binding dehydrogenase n=1 Tax=Planosporangium thailandense TaxID=765197 RepID=A0ABX0Y822_9ACTN|nr:zinc-binding dehydrogenase [Planosporangium thailandense]NJC73419.1 zinc-binding dehydrogenase [Planosporangium thailandense]